MVSFRAHAAGLASSLMTRVRSYVGPRELPTGDTFADGMERQLSIPQASQTRWFLSDLEAAVLSSDTGNLKLAGRLCKSLRRDGVIHGVLSTRTEGLVQLPVRFKGSDALVAAAQEDFRAVFPQPELALLAGDGRLLGVGVAEFVQIEGARPVLRRLDPEFLWYRWAEDRWYYQSIHGMLPINPGDGRWVLHIPGGSVQPWQQGLWMALGRAYIAKEHAYFLRENYSSKLANPARVAVAPQGASDAMTQSFFQKLAAWGVNTVFALKPGWDVKIVEAKGEGYQVFQQTIETCNEEMIITVAGQVVTTTGGTGFTNANVFSAIRADLIQADSDGLAATLNAQGLPVWANERFGNDAGDIACAWDVTPPKDLNSEATALTGAANAVKALNEVLAQYGDRVDIREIARRFGVPIEQLEQAARDANVTRLASVRRAA